MDIFARYGFGGAGQNQSLVVRSLGERAVSAALAENVLQEVSVQFAKTAPPPKEGPVLQTPVLQPPGTDFADGGVGACMSCEWKS